MAAGNVADSARRAAPDSVVDPNVSPVLTMRNVQFRFTKDLVVGIDRIRAQMRPAPPATVVSFDDPASFDLDVAGAVGPSDLPQVEVLMNTRIFAYPNANVRNLRVEADGQNLVIHGTLSKGATIPFTMGGTPSIREGRWLAIETKEVKIGAVGVTGLLSALHISLSAMINVPASGNLRVEKNTILIDVFSNLPPPHLHGAIASLDCCAHGFGLVIGSPNAVSDSALRGARAVRDGVAELRRHSARPAQVRQAHDGGLRPRPGGLPTPAIRSTSTWVDTSASSPRAYAHATLQYGWRVRMPDFDKLTGEQCPTDSGSRAESGTNRPLRWPDVAAPRQKS